MKGFHEIWEIYCDSFPKDERRDLYQQKSILNNEMYILNPIYDNGIVVGFYAVWDLDTFAYVEHLAIDEKFRGKGLGSKAVKNIINKFNKKIILEVEEPETDEAKRRINFYERLGLYLNQYDYEQPAYDKDKKSLPMLIMSYPSKITITEFNDMKNKLYNVVYMVNENK